MKRFTNNMDDSNRKVKKTRDLAETVAVQSFEDELMAMENNIGQDIIDWDSDIRTDEAVEKFSRQSMKKENEARNVSKSLSFQWIDIDMTSGDPMSSNPDGSEVIGLKVGPVPIVRIYGVTHDGLSVVVYAHGFLPYLYIQLPPGINTSNPDLTDLRNYLEQKMRERAKGEEKKLLHFVVAVEKILGKHSLVGFQFEDSREFLKVTVAMPSLVPSLKRIVEEGVPISSGYYRCQSFESNVPFILRFMIDNNIHGANWLELRDGTYRYVESASSRCTIEIETSFNNIISYSPEGSWSIIAPLRILSFDIECAGRKGHFPDASQDPVIQIASTLTIQGSENPTFRIVFTLGTCLPIVGAQVVPSDSEAEMLMKWRTFVVNADPDIVTGYNIANFDIPYLLNRAKALERNSPELKRFPDLGRIKGLRAMMKETVFQSSAFGKRENIDTSISGRVIFDVLPYMYRNHKLSSYSLNSVSSEFLGQQKEDVHHSIISDLQSGTDSDRRRLAVYCLKDAHLPQQLMSKLSILVNYIEMARVTGVPINYLLQRGQQIKVFSMLLRKTKNENLLIPHLGRYSGDENSYEGATVIDPKKAFYEVPIATLDFASLYPSIMQAHNLCYSTLLSQDDLKRLNDDEYERSPTGHYFVKASRKKGILPQILDELLAARKRAKKDMASATDPMMKAVQNGRQLALKISANSVYGFTGATVGQLPCLPIASSVTAFGRNLLFETKAFVENTYTVANGFKFNAEVIYGDTDSVMVKFGSSTVEEVMPIATKAADEISAIFPQPIKLEFEKIYFPYLLMNKKRYAGLIWTSPAKYDKLDAKGLETVRRDNCLLVRKLVDTCLRKLLIERDVQGAIDYTKNTISDLLLNKLDISMLVISKSLGKSADDADYNSKQAHVELAMRMKKRDPGSAPNVGDRVAYVIIQAAKGSPAYEKSEDPVYVLDNNLPIDTEYYLTNQLSNPITRIFEPIIPNPQVLLSGDHTRTVSKPTPNAKAGGIMMFAVKKETCLGCKTVFSDRDKVLGSPLCVNCHGKEGDIYLSRLEELNHQQHLFNQLWTECQRCQGSLNQSVICSNRDCPIFYKRKKVQIDVKTAQAVIDKFSW